jgi:hypothetical protein
MDNTIEALTKGTHNLLDAELIPQDAASASRNWITVDGKIQLAGGRIIEGDDNGVGQIHGQHFGYKADGTKVHWRKSGTAIQYLSGSTWTDVVTGLSETDYVFANYSSLAGSFTFAFGVDGIYKFHNANPGSYLAMYDPTRNFKGYALIDRGRTILWNRTEDKTGLYGSKIDPQGTNYTTQTAVTLGSGDGADTTFSGTLSGAGQINYFAFTPYAPIAAPTNISAITLGGLTTITSNSHGLAAGDYVRIESITGTTQLNNMVVKVYSVPDVNTIIIAINSTAYTAYSSGGTLKKVEYFTDSYLGTLTSNLGGTGTINYLTGAWTLTFNTAPTNVASNIKANYQYENSNDGGITDFRYSSTRAAGEGFVFPQDEGGDAILTVLIGQDGAYYSLKRGSVYRLELEPTDTNATNLVYRRDLGVPFFRAATSTSRGIVFMNTANSDKPVLTVLQRNPLGDNIEPNVLFPHFDFSNYVYDDACIDTHDSYVVVACKSAEATKNDVVLLCDLLNNTVDETAYHARMFSKNDGNLYVGSSITENTYLIFSGYDDDGVVVENYWISSADKFKTTRLKKFRWLRVRGSIHPDQYCEVYIDYDGAGFQLVGTIRGDGGYVDNTEPDVIGQPEIGGSQVGGEQQSTIFPFYMEMKVKAPKFRKRRIKFVAKGIGYMDVQSIEDHDVFLFEDKLPRSSRIKQNVSLDGTQTGLANPEY